MIKAQATNVRLTSRKARLIIDLVRGKSVEYSLDILKMVHSKAAPIISKVIKSAVANSKLEASHLFVSTAYVNAGSIIKRMVPRARGRANVIHKKLSHVTIFLSERS